MPLLCDRPLARNVDYENSRFVVCDGKGISLGGEKLEYGDELPKGVLSARALRYEYDLPLHRIETFEFAAKIPELREACAKRGVDLGLAVTARDVIEQKPLQAETKKTNLNLESLNIKELGALCREYRLNPNGNMHQLRSRIAAHLG